MKNENENEKPKFTKAGLPWKGAGGARTNTRKPTPFLEQKSVLTIRVQNKVIIHNGGKELIEQEWLNFLNSRFNQAHSMPSLNEEEIRAKAQPIEIL